MSQSGPQIQDPKHFVLWNRRHIHYSFRRSYVITRKTLAFSSTFYQIHSYIVKNSEPKYYSEGIFPQGKCMCVLSFYRIKLIFWHQFAAIGQKYSSLICLLHSEKFVQKAEITSSSKDSLLKFNSMYYLRIRESCVTHAVVRSNSSGSGACILLRSIFPLLILPLKIRLMLWRERWVKAIGTHYMFCHQPKFCRKSFLWLPTVCFI
jgi:hypothetical protein